MKSKGIAVLMVFMIMFAFAAPSGFAIGAKQGTASLLLPTTGQAMNNQLGTTKSKVMAGVEVAGVTTLAILGGTVGGPVIWAALGPLIANHIWSSVDAYQSAQQTNPMIQQQMTEAQRTLEFSRQRRFDREQAAHLNSRDRIQMAGEQAAMYAR